MKKYFLVFIALCGFTAAYTQTEKGNKFIGGQINVSSYTTTILDSLFPSSSNTTSFTIAPNIAYFVANNLAIGVNITYSHSGSSPKTIFTQRKADDMPRAYEYTNKVSTNEYGAGIFAKYFIGISNSFKLFVKGTVNYAYTTQEVNNVTIWIYEDDYHTTNTTNKYKGNTISSAIAPGIVYFVTPRLGIQTSFGKIKYQYTSRINQANTTDNHESTSTYGLDLNVSSVEMGVNYYF